MTTFEDYIHHQLQMARENMIDSIEGREPRHVCPKRIYHRFIALEDFVYNHSDQDPNHGVYEFVRGQEYDLKSKEDQYFLPDRTKLQYIGTIEK